MEHQQPKKASFGTTTTTVLGQKEKISGLIIDTFERVESAFSRLSVVEKQLDLGTTYFNEEPVLTEQVKEFDLLLNQKFLPLLLLASQIGVAIEDQMESLYNQASCIRSLISVSSVSKRPPHPESLMSPLVEFSKLDFSVTKRPVEKYSHLQSILKFISTSFLWPMETDPVTYVKKYELEVNDIASGITRVQNPIYLKFADFSELFIKEMINFVTKHYKSGFTWNSNSTQEAPNHLQFSIYGCQGILSFSTAPSRTSSRVAETRNNWLCEFQGEINKKIEFESKAERISCLVFSCLKTHVTIKGRPDGVRIENCENVTIVFEDIINTVDVVSCRNVEIICNGAILMLNFNLTNGCLVVLNEKNSQDIR